MHMILIINIQNIARVGLLLIRDSSLSLRMTGEGRGLGMTLSPVILEAEGSFLESSRG